jgi:serine/threonine protein kinase
MESSAQGTRISELEGQRLGPYQIVELIGRGGMAVVYKALQPALRRHVAIKVLPPYFVHEEGFRGRFQQEAEVVARLEHPNILPIYDYGQEGDVPYIVMPYVSGGTMRDWLANSVPLDRALQAYSRILSALEYAHTREPAIIHRDIKPTNILMSQGDWPLLTDFGIAKIVEPSLRATRSGTMVGTPEYMSPEQSQGTGVDHRADLYAMGVMLYEMLTGRLPFQGQTPLALILAHVKDEVPSPRTFNPELSPVWDEVIRRSLAKEPAERYASAKAMDEAIQAAWRQVQRESGEWQTAGMADPGQLYDSAVQALSAGDWQRVISLCGQLLEVDPAHAEAVNLLTQAQEGMRRERAAELVRQAQAALAAEQYGAASRRYREALQLDPALAEAESGLERVRHEQALASLYHGARRVATSR